MLGGLLRWLQLTIEPAYHSVGFQEIGPAAVRTLERALFLPIERSAKTRGAPQSGQVGRSAWPMTMIPALVPAHRQLQTHRRFGRSTEGTPPSCKATGDRCPVRRGCESRSASVQGPSAIAAHLGGKFLNASARLQLFPLPSERRHD